MTAAALIQPAISSLDDHYSIVTISVTYYPYLQLPFAMSSMAAEAQDIQSRRRVCIFCAWKFYSAVLLTMFLVRLLCASHRSYWMVLLAIEYNGSLNHINLVTIPISTYAPKWTWFMAWWPTMFNNTLFAILVRFHYLSDRQLYWAWLMHRASISCCHNDVHVGIIYPMFTLIPNRLLFDKNLRSYISSTPSLHLQT